jgi:AMIN domain
VRAQTLSSACLLLALALAASAEEQGRLVGVRATGGAQASSVEIEGDRPLSFTTMKLLGPPRVVVDFADTEVAAEQRELEIDDGVLRRAAMAQAGSRTARVVIELVADAEFDVRADGNRVEVRVTRPGAVAAEEPADAEAEKVASLPKVSLVGSRPAEAPDDATRPRSAAEKAEALKKTLAEQRKREAADKAAKKSGARRAAVTAPTVALREPVPQPKAAAPAAKPAQKVAMAGSRHITGIGFRPVQGGEVIVRSDQPLEYGVSGEGTAILLHLPSAAIPLPNNRRPLDTQFFDGAVRRVVPLAAEGGTDVRIELREHAEYRLAQTGSVLTVTFAAPK